MSRPLVSVIMIFLDAERFIEEAIASVVAQSWPHWELLLVDDGSRDGSTAIARAWAKRQPERVRYLEHPGHANCGMSAARNLGLAHARGELVAFLDADDVFLPERLARHVALLACHPEVDMVQSRYEIWYSWQKNGPRLDDDHVGPSIEPYDRILAPPLCLALMLAVPAIAPGTCNVTLRREAAQAAGGFEERFRGLFEDQVFFARVYLKSTILVIPDVLARYRRHADACTRRQRGDEEAAARLAFLRCLERDLDAATPMDSGALEPVRRWLASEREAVVRPARRLGHRLLPFANDLLLSALPARAYLGLVRLRRMREERLVSRRVAEVLATAPPRLVGEAQP
jgi:glycosyltransferase involved in cell wall biosynthesis